MNKFPGGCSDWLACPSAGPDWLRLAAVANRSRSGWLWAGLELLEPPRHTSGKIGVGLGTLAGTVTWGHLPVEQSEGSWQ